eukprot:UN11475
MLYDVRYFGFSVIVFAALQTIHDRKRTYIIKNMLFNHYI